MKFHFLTTFFPWLFPRLFASIPCSFTSILSSFKLFHYSKNLGFELLVPFPFLQVLCFPRFSTVFTFTRFPSSSFTVTQTLTLFRLACLRLNYSTRSWFRVLICLYREKKHRQSQRLIIVGVNTVWNSPFLSTFIFILLLDFIV